MLRIILVLSFFIFLSACQKTEEVTGLDGTPNTKGKIATQNCPQIVGQYTCTEFDAYGRSYTEPLTVSETSNNGVRVFTFSKTNSSGTQNFDYYNDAKLRSIDGSNAKYFSYCENYNLYVEIEETYGQDTISTNLTFNKNASQLQTSIQYVRKSNGQVIEQSRETRYCKVKGAF